MMKRIPINTRYFVLTTLASSILLSQNVYALQELADNDLSSVNAQDGLYIQTEYKQMDFDQLYWQDKVGTPTGENILNATANVVKLRKNNNYLGGGYQLGTNYKIQTGTTVTGGNATAGLDFEIESMPSTISVQGFKVCNQTTGNCDPLIGNVAIQTDSPQYIHFQTKNGLFDPNSQSDLRLNLQNINMYFGLNNGATNYYNQLILKNFNFNFLGKGVMYVDPVKGLMLQTNNASILSPASKTQIPTENYGYIDFARASIPNMDATQSANATYKNSSGIATSSGLNIEMMTKKDAYVDPTNPVYALASGTNETDSAKGLIRVGASGRMVNSYLQIRGINTKSQDQTKNILGYATSADNGDPTTTTRIDGNDTVLGSTGIGVRLRGEFTNDGDAMLGANLGSAGEATTLEIGGAGANTFGFEFSKLSPLMSNSNDRAYFDSGNVYLGLANTRHLLLPNNAVLNSARLGGTGGTLTTGNDYKQQIADTNTIASGLTPNSLVVGIRGGEFQAVSKRGRFTSSAGVSNANAIPATGVGSGLDNKWGLGLPYYNLNSNIAVYSTKYTGSVYNLNNLTNTVTKTNVTNLDRLGLAIGLSVQGRNDDGTKTTSIMVVDADRNYYIGLRNIDMLLRGYGSMGFENGNVNVDLKNLLMVMAAEISAGYLPSYVNPNLTEATGLNAASNIKNSFKSKDDVLFGLKLKMLGDMNFSLVPNNEISNANGNRLSIVGRYKLTDGTIQLSDPIEDSIIGFDRISGLMAFNNAIVVNKDSVGFNYSFDINPASDQSSAEREVNVLRVRDINFYPPVDPPAGWNTSTMGTYNNRAQRLGEMVMTGGRISSEFTLKPRN